MSRRRGRGSIVSRMLKRWQWHPSALIRLSSTSWTPTRPHIPDPLCPPSRWRGSSMILFLLKLYTIRGNLIGSGAARKYTRLMLIPPFCPKLWSIFPGPKRKFLPPSKLSRTGRKIRNTSEKKPESFLYFIFPNLSGLVNYTIPEVKKYFHLLFLYLLNKKEMKNK